MAFSTKGSEQKYQLEVKRIKLFTDAQLT